MDETAIRHTRDKVDLSLLPMNACLEECKVWMRGEKIYGRDNWKLLWGPETTRVVIASLLRHALKIASGERMDQESGLTHAAHIRCNAAMLIEHYENQGLIHPSSYTPFEDEGIS